MDSNQLVASLNHLITTCTDSEKGYRTAADCVRNVQLKALFATYASERGQFAAELAEEVRRHGGVPDDGGSVTGAFWRGWTNLKAVVTGGDEKAVVDECQQSEEGAVKAYESVQTQECPPELTAILTRQVQRIREAIERLQALSQLAAKLVNS